MRFEFVWGSIVKSRLVIHISIRSLCLGAFAVTISDLVQPLAHRLFGLAANLIANSYG
jgi:hypothetical protein